MPGTPPVTPRYGAPRFTQSDFAIFTTDINPIVDAFDNSAKLTELQAETAARTTNDLTIDTARATGDATEAANRIAGIATEAGLRRAGDTEVFVHVATMDDQTTPPQPGGSVVGHVPCPVLANGEQLTLVGAASRCMGYGSVRSVYRVSTDHGRGDGSLAVVTGLSAVQPATGRYVRTLSTNAGVASPLPLDDLDTIAVVLVTPGDSRGCSIALLFGRSNPS